MPVAEERLAVLQIYKVLQCVRQEDKIQLEKLVKFGIPELINFTEPREGESALHLASVANNMDMCNFLLGLGALPDVQDKCGCTPVMKAAELGHDQIVEVLAKANADMTIVDNEGKGVLFYCISATKRHLRCLRLALEYGADVKNCSLKGIPVFLLACKQASECKEMCLLMLEKGADPNARDMNTDHTALMEAAREGAVDVVRSILRGKGDVNSLDKGRNHAAHFAAEGGFFQVLRLLSAYGGDLGIIAMDGNTPLHYAAKGGFIDCCKFIAQRGCNPKFKNTDGLTPRLLAKQYGQKAVMKELKKAERTYAKYSKPGNVNPNKAWAVRLYDWSLENENVLRSSFEATGIGEGGTVLKEEFITELQKREAPITAEEIQKIIQAHDKSHDGKVNLNEFFKGSKYLSKPFLMSSYESKKKGKKGKKGKDKLSIPMPICTVPDNLIFRRENGGPPHFMIESYEQFTDSSRFDRDHPPEHPLQDDSAWYLDLPDKSYTNINFVAKAGDIESLKRAFAEGVPVDVRDTFYKTPLMAACAHGNMEVVNFLISAGADINACDNFQWTPLHHACHAGQLDIVELLVKSGAGIDVVATNGSTPLMRAIESCSLDCVQYLINAGAKVQLENKKEQNALDIAKAYADFRIIEVVKAKLDSLPKPKDKKKKKSIKAASKPQAKSDSAKEKEQPQMIPAASPPQQQGEQKNELQKSSMMHQNALTAKGATKKIDITYVPKSTWGPQLTTQDLVKKKEERRERFSYEVDFEDFMMPFKKNFMAKSLSLGGPEAD